MNRAETHALEAMRIRGGDWYAYQNIDLGHPEAGHLQFLQCGEGKTYPTPPATAPDTGAGLGWRYKLVGKVNLRTGEVEL